MRSTRSTEPVRTREFSAPIAGASSGRLVLEHGTPDLRIAGDGSIDVLARGSFRGHLPEVRVDSGKIVVSYPAYRPARWLVRLRRARGVLALNPDKPWRFELSGGVHRLHADLRSLIVDGVAIHGGVTSADLWLPKPRGTASIELAGGVNNVSIHRPDGVPVRLSVHGGISSLSFDAEEFGSFGREIRRQTVGWSDATDRLAISIAGGVNHLNIVNRIENRPMPLTHDEGGEER
jgi:hypothetical protein